MCKLHIVIDLRSVSDLFFTSNYPVHLYIFFLTYNISHKIKKRSDFDEIFSVMSCQFHNVLVC